MTHQSEFIERRQGRREEKRAQVEVLNMGDDASIPFYQELVLGEAIDVSDGGLRLRVNSMFAKARRSAF